MWMLLTAVATASLLGSMHCVGMCGPLAIWASGATNTQSSGPGHANMAWATALYHFGRLLTYALAGLIAGLLGQLVDVGGNALGIQLIAAKIVGVAMIIVGVVKLIQIVSSVRAKGISTVTGSKPSLITRILVKMRPLVFKLPIAARGLATGLLTAFLPCGWLYLFALVAAGTGSTVMGPIVMIAFWIGTVPALVGLVAGSQALAIRFRKTVPTIAAALLILGGCYTASGRGFANLNSLSDIQIGKALESKPVDSDSDSATANQTMEALAGEMETIVKTELPCCVDSEKTQGSSGAEK